MKSHLTPIIGAEGSTIKLGSTGSDVEKWQKIIGVTVDGKFGPATETATKKWQKEHGLKEDGIVGPQTWASSQSKIQVADMFGWVSAIPLWLKVAFGTVIAGVIVIAKKK